MDSLCLARSIVVSIARHEIFVGGIERRSRQTNVRRLERWRVENEEGAAEALHRMARIPTNLPLYDLRHVKKFQKVINALYPNQYRIVVFDGGKRNRIVYKGANAPTPCTISLLFWQSHYNAIGEPRELFKVGKFQLKIFPYFFALLKLLAMFILLF